MTPAAASFTPRPPAPRTFADTLQLIALKSPRDAAALKIVAEMVLARILSNEQSPH